MSYLSMHTQQDSLPYRIQGVGEPVLCVHGWGSSSAVWAPWEGVQQICPDLYGHGKASDLPIPTGSLLLANSSAMPRLDCSTAIGWSCGGSVLLQGLADGHFQFRKLVLVSSFACFMVTPDHPAGWPQRTVAYWQQRLQHKPDETLRKLYSYIPVASVPPLTLPVARQYLTEMFTINLCPVLSKIKIPVLVITCREDPLVAPSCSQFLASALQNARMVEFDHPGHAPFYTHTEQFAETLREFLHE